jgi:hypothetical protein
MLSALLKPLHSKEKSQVLEAINSLRFKVTPENIALSTSLPIATASQQLNIIAAETAAHLKVDSSGALLYEFAPGFERAYIYDIGKQLFTVNGNFFFKLLRVAFRLAMGLVMLAIKLSITLLNFLFRAMFGLLLIGSLIAIVLGIVAAIASIFDSDGGGFDIGGIGDGFGDGLWNIGSSVGSVDWHFDWFAYDCARLFTWSYYWGDPFMYGYSPYGYSYDYYRPETGNARNTPAPSVSTQIEAEKKGDFVTDCFSYLFGDGNPNADLEERKWHQIGLVIKRNHGVVVAEQIAPFVGDESGNEDWMLPVLVHFNGSPEVSDKGNILYVFPSFVKGNNISNSSSQLSFKPQTEANGGDALRDLYRSHLRRKADHSWTGNATNPHSQLSRSLEERHWEFSLQGVDTSCKIGTLTLLNLVGSFWFYMATIKTPILVPFHHVSYYMMAYAIFLIVFPACRFFNTLIQNVGIDNRNEIRSKFASALSAPSAELKEKLTEASAHVNHLLLAPQPSIVYTTEEDSLEQQFTAIPKFNHSRNYSR